MTGHFRSDRNGSAYPVAGKVAAEVPQKIEFSVQFPRARQTYEGYLWTEGKNAIAGTVSMLDHPYSFIAVREGTSLGTEIDLGLPGRHCRIRRPAGRHNGVRGGAIATLDGVAMFGRGIDRRGVKGRSNEPATGVLLRVADAVPFERVRRAARGHSSRRCDFRAACGGWRNRGIKTESLPWSDVREFGRPRSQDREMFMTGSFKFPRVQVDPADRPCEPGDRRRERVGYEFGEGASRPFLFPLVGPSGAALTRWGIPIRSATSTTSRSGSDTAASAESILGGAAQHRYPDSPASMRLYQDGETWGGLVADLDWWAHGRAILRQELTIVIEPRPRQRRFTVDLQSRFDSPDGNPVELGKTNFGFLGVRVAKTMSEHSAAAA